MAENPEAAGSGKRIPWEKYVADARDLFLATATAGPAALQVWTTAWCDWAKSAAKTHDQLARRWNQIIDDPGQGATILDQMRQDWKEYLIGIAGIPERATLDFLQTMAERGNIGTEVKSLNNAFVAAADDALTAIMDAYSQVAAAVEGQPAAPAGLEAGKYKAPGGAPAAPAPLSADQLAELRKRMARLKLTNARLGGLSSPPTA
jgi:hypothetical protein